MSFLSYIKCLFSEIYVLLVGIILFFQFDEQEQTMTTTICSSKSVTLCSNESLLLYSFAQSKGKERQSTTTSRGTQKSTFHGLGGLGEGVGQGSGHGGGCGYGQECEPR